jgi:hypothetical protein
MPVFLTGPRTGFVDRMKGKGMCSSGFLQQVGNSAALSAGGGNVFTFLSVAGAGNGADATDDTLTSCILPANLFDVPGRCVTVQAWGNIPAGSATKTLQFKFGASALQSIISYTTTNTGNWQFYVQIFKVSANVQQLLYSADGGGTTASLLGAGAVGRSTLVVAAAEVDTAPIPLVITGKASSSVASLVICQGMIVDAYN